MSQGRAAPPHLDWTDEGDDGQDTGFGETKSKKSGNDDGTCFSPTSPSLTSRSASTMMEEEMDRKEAGSRWKGQGMWHQMRGRSELGEGFEDARYSVCVSLKLQKTLSSPFTFPSHGLI